MPKLFFPKHRTVWKPKVGLRNYVLNNYQCTDGGRHCYVIMNIYSWYPTMVNEMLFVIEGVSPSEYTCVPMQGSGSFALESVLTTTVPKLGGKVRVLDDSSFMNLSHYLQFDNCSDVFCFISSFNVPEPFHLLISWPSLSVPPLLPPRSPHLCDDPVGSHPLAFATSSSHCIVQPLKPIRWLGRRQNETYFLQKLLILTWISRKLLDSL